MYANVTSCYRVGLLFGDFLRVLLTYLCGEYGSHVFGSTTTFGVPRDCGYQGPRTFTIYRRKGHLVVRVIPVLGAIGADLRYYLCTVTSVYVTRRNGSLFVDGVCRFFRVHY